MGDGTARTLLEVIWKSVILCDIVGYENIGAFKNETFFNVRLILR